MRFSASGAVAALSALALAVTAGCGDADRLAVRDPEKASASPTGVGLKLSGIVVLDTETKNPDDEDTWTLRAFDAENGENTVTLTLPAELNGRHAHSFSSMFDDSEPTKSAEARAAFSADWRYAAWASREGIELFRLGPAQRAYTHHGTIAPGEGSYSGGAVRYDTPWFAQQGKRLWFEATPTDGPAKLMSVDYESPGEPREEGDVKPHVDWRLLSNGEPIQTARSDDGGLDDMYLLDGTRVPEIGESGSEEHLRYVMADGAVIGGRLIVPSGDGHARHDFVGAIAADTMLMTSSESGKGPRTYGEVVTVRVDAEQEEVAVERVAEHSADALRGVALSPDKKQVLLATSGGWFIKDLGSDKEPGPVRNPIAPHGSSPTAPYVLGWY